LKQREGGRIVSVVAIITVAVNTHGGREIVGLHISPSEAETFWSTFLKHLARRGLRVSSWSSRMLMTGSSQRSGGSPAPVGSAAAWGR
jgi:hypothetical protein